MPGLVPGIHVLMAVVPGKTWMAATSPAMTTVKPIHLPSHPFFMT
jgi:hypothetical protein